MSRFWNHWLTALLLMVIHPLFSMELRLGIDRLLEEREFYELLKGKKIALLTNHAAINREKEATYRRLHREKERLGFTLPLILAPEHGLFGEGGTHEAVQYREEIEGSKVYALSSSIRRPTSEMLLGIDLILCDVQDVGVRSYTYASTLFYLMEEAAKLSIPLIVLDRPNPLGGNLIDGRRLDPSWRSFIGYVDVPYVHGLTIAELASYFNERYRPGCDLRLIPMKGWSRDMRFEECSLPWIPPSPNIPTLQALRCYPATGLFAGLGLVSIGKGTALPFQLIGAPWIDGHRLAQTLNEQKCSAIHFFPFHFTPTSGPYAKEHCQGVYLHIDDPTRFFPVKSFYMILSSLKRLYPEEFQAHLNLDEKKLAYFFKALGTNDSFELIKNERYFMWELIKRQKEGIRSFEKEREPYLIKNYNAAPSLP